MKVIPNNCVSEIKIPASVETASGVDYNPVLGLYATFNYDDGVSVWNPLSGKVVAEFEELGENFRDTLFVPGNRLAISSSEGHHGGIIEICTVGEDKSDSTEFEIDSEDIPVTYPGAIALSPGGNLLVTDAFNSDGVYEMFMDWHDLKVLKSREIIPVHEEAESGIELLSCSRDFEVATYVPPNVRQLAPRTTRPPDNSPPLWTIRPHSGRLTPTFWTISPLPYSVFKR